MDLIYRKFKPLVAKSNAEKSKHRKIKP